MVREVSVSSSAEASGGDPLKAEERESDVASSREEDELDIVQVDLEERETSEGGGEESHGEDLTPHGREFILFYLPAMHSESAFRSERNASETAFPPINPKTPVKHMLPQPERQIPINVSKPPSNSPRLLMSFGLPLSPVVPVSCLILVFPPALPHSRS